MMRFFIIVIVTFCTLFFACKSVFQVVNGSSAFENKEYSVAIEMLTNEYKKTSDPDLKNEIAKKLAISYDNINRADRAAFYYKIAMKGLNDPNLFFKYGKMLKKTEDFEAALAFFENYLKGNPIDKSRIVKEVNSCKKALKWKANPTKYQIKNLANINTSFSDYAPSVYNTDFLVFTSARKEATGEADFAWTGESFSDLFITTIKAEDEKVLEAKQLKGNINTEFNEGTSNFSSDFKTMYFTKCGSENDRNDNCQIYESKLVNGNWTKGKKLDLGFPSDNLAQPFISKNGRKLYFSNDAASGFGDKDIYVSTFRDGNWQKGMNLGSTINTNAYEGYPYLAEDGTFYFASNGHLGMGGLDIFKTNFTAGKNDKIENLQSPINSGADDFGITFLAQTEIAKLLNYKARGFISSTRKGGKGNDDIYYFKLVGDEEENSEITESNATINTNKKGIIYILTGTIYKSIFEENDNPNSEIIDLKIMPNVPVEIYGISENSNIATRIITDENGSFEIEIEGNSVYEVSATFPAYLKASNTVSSKNKVSKENKIINIDTEIILDGIYKNVAIVIENVNFEEGESELSTQSKQTLNELLAMLYQNPKLNIEIGNYSNNKGSDKSILKLTDQRALTILNYLIENGIDANRLIEKGYGKSSEEKTTYKVLNF